MAKTCSKCVKAFKLNDLDIYYCNDFVGVDVPDVEEALVTLSQFLVDEVDRPILYTKKVRQTMQAPDYNDKLMRYFITPQETENKIIKAHPEWVKLFDQDVICCSAPGLSYIINLCSRSNLDYEVKELWIAFGVRNPDAVAALFQLRPQLFYELSQASIDEITSLAEAPTEE